MLTKIEQFRAAFHKNESYLYFNNAGMGPLSAPAREAVRYWTDRLFMDADRCYLEAAAMMEETRARVASLFRAKTSEVAFFPSCAAAISQVALGFPFSPGDEILVWGQEYPSNFYPWRVAAERSGARFVVVPPEADLQAPVERLIEHITPKTKMIAVSWVQYRTGAVTDLQALTAITRPRGIFVCADIIQGGGVRAFDFVKSGVDAACGGNHKWMCSPIGAGFLILKEEHITRLRPISVGAMSFGTGEDLASVTQPYRLGIERFEPGAKNILDIAGLGATARLMHETGTEAIEAETESVASFLREGLLEIGYCLNSAHHGPIVNFGPTANSPLKSIEDLVTRLFEKRVGFANRPPGIRLSPHAFTTRDEVQKVLKFLS